MMHVSDPGEPVDVSSAAKLSADLTGILRRVGTGPMTLGDILLQLKGRGFAVLILLLTLPFSPPISIPGLSTPIGLAIAFLAARMALGRRIWLPSALLEKPIPSKFVVFAVRAGIKLSRFLERFARPRLGLLHGHGISRRLVGLAVFVAAIALCLPPPMLNVLPAWAIIFLCAGLMERDGILIAIGYLWTALIWLGLAVLVYLGSEGILRGFGLSAAAGG